MDKIKKFDYEGTPISFEFSDGNKMINATQMAKPFKKRINDYLRLNGTKEFIALLDSRYGNSRNGKRETIRVVQGGTPELQGTWMDEKLALEFAAWLSPAFKLWVYDRIEELLKTGKTEMRHHTPGMEMIRAIRMIADRLEYHERDIEELKTGLQEVKDYVGDLEAKILSIDENYYAISGYCAKNGILCPLDKAQSWGLQATRLSHSKQVAIGKAYDAKYGEINTYHLEILEEVFKKYG